MRWLADDLSGVRSDAEGSAEDRSAIAALRASEVDLSRAQDVAHRLRFSDATSSRIVAELIHKRGRTVVVDPTGEESGCLVTVFAHHELTLDAIGTLRAEFEAVASGMGGSYDGWSLVGGPDLESGGDR